VDDIVAAGFSSTSNQSPFHMELLLQFKRVVCHGASRELCSEGGNQWADFEGLAMALATITSLKQFWFARLGKQAEP
jgi:hypothetical protein